MYPAKRNLYNYLQYARIMLNYNKMYFERKTFYASNSAFADLGSYSFDITLGNHESSSNVRKSDNEQRAYVSITNTTAHSGDIITFRDRRSSDGASATEAKNGIGQSYTFTLNYTI